MKNNIKIIEKLRELLPHLQKEFNISKIELFGSVASGNFSSGSDLDLIYHLKDRTTLTFAQYVRLKELIAENVDFDKIDLIRAENLNPIIRMTSEHNRVNIDG